MAYSAPSIVTPIVSSSNLGQLHVNFGIFVFVNFAYLAACVLCSPRPLQARRGGSSKPLPPIARKVANPLRQKLGNCRIAWLWSACHHGNVLGSSFVQVVVFLRMFQLDSCWVVTCTLQKCYTFLLRKHTKAQATTCLLRVVGAGNIVV